MSIFSKSFFWVKKLSSVFYSIRYTGNNCYVCDLNSTNVPRVLWKMSKYYTFTDCGGSYTNASGVLTSPSYPNPYPRLARCTYLISQPIGTYVNISFINMDVNCKKSYLSYDYIEMRDGNSEDSPIMGRFCGNGSNLPTFMQNTQNHLRIRWRRGTCLTAQGTVL